MDKDSLLIGGPFNGNSYIIPDSSDEYRIPHHMIGGLVEHVYVRTGARQFKYQETIGVFETPLDAPQTGVKLVERPVYEESQR